MESENAVEEAVVHPKEEEKEEIKEVAVKTEPHSEEVKALLARTGYQLECYSTCRTYGGPPPDYTGDEPSDDCQVFIGRLPLEMKEDEIVPVFEKIGRIYVLRLIMEKGQDVSRGFAFLYYTTPEDAENAIKELNHHEIRPGVTIVVSKSDGNKRLYMGNIQKDKTQEELLSELQTLFPSVKHVFTQQDPNEPQYNRGFAFVDFADHKTAVEVRKICYTSKKILFGRQIRNVDWADFQQVFSEEEVNAVKSLYVTPVTDFSEEKIRGIFEVFGTVEKVQKIRDFAFVHMATRDQAVKAKDEVDKTIDGNQIEVSFANPRHSVKKKRKPRGALRLRGKGRGYKNDGYYPDFDYYGDPVYSGGYDDGYSGYGGGCNGGYGSADYRGTGTGYYDNTGYKDGGAGVWMSKRRKPNYDRHSEKWSDPNVTNQVGGASGGNWW